MSPREFDGTNDNLSSGETLTATGTTVSPMVTACVRPGTMTGVGW